MPLYFFDTVNGSRFHDEQGMELASPDEARLYAIKFAGQCLASDPKPLCEGDFRVEARNAAGLLLFAVTTFLTEAPAMGSASPGSPD